MVTKLNAIDEHTTTVHEVDVRPNDIARGITGCGLYFVFPINSKDGKSGWWVLRGTERLVTCLACLAK